MNATSTAAIVRSTAGAACLTFALWSLAGCGGGDSHDEAGHSHASGEADDGHSHDEAESGDHAHGDEEGDHGHLHDFVEPKTLSDALHMIQESMESIEDALAEKRLADIHGDAEIVTEAARLLGQLALADGSGVERAAIRDINVAGRELASAGDALHEVLDEGDLAKSQTEFDRMKVQFETLSRYAGPADDHDHDDSDHDDADHDDDH